MSPFPPGTKPVCLLPISRPLSDLSIPGLLSAFHFSFDQPYSMGYIQSHNCHPPYSCSHLPKGLHKSYYCSSISFKSGRPQRLKADHRPPLLQAHMLVLTHSPHNTPILPTKKLVGSFCLVQDLRCTNFSVHPTYLVILNPMPSSQIITITFFCILNLKDAFFTISLYPASQTLFVFNLSDPNSCLS